MSIRVLLVDDHAIVRDGLAALLGAEMGIDVCGRAADGREALALVAAGCAPDVVVMDLNMPGLNGVETTHRLREHAPGARVLVLSMHGTSEHIFRALQAGASGYLLKDTAGREVATAVRAVAAGRRYLSPAVADMARDAYRAASGTRGPLDGLSSRERQLLQLLAEGRSNREIAAQLALSIKTVETYRSRLLQKLGLHDLASLIRFALEHGLA